jgi:hypothetical protein
MVEDFPRHACRHWALDGTETNDGSVLLGATQLSEAQKFASLPDESTDPFDHLIAAGITAMNKANHNIFIDQTPPGMTEKRQVTAAQLVENGQGSGNARRRNPNSPRLVRPRTNISSTSQVARDALTQKRNSQAKRPTNPALLQAKISSTTSAKMSYLLHQILQFHKEEKILVFYEHDNTAVGR